MQVHIRWQKCYKEKIVTQLLTNMDGYVLERKFVR